MIPLHKWIDIHQETKTGWKNMVRYFREVCTGSTFSIQVREIFNGNGYSDN